MSYELMYLLITSIGIISITVLFIHKRWRQQEWFAMIFALFAFVLVIAVGATYVISNNI